MTISNQELERVAREVFEKLRFEFPITVGRLDFYDKESMCSAIKSGLLSALKQVNKEKEEKGLADAQNLKPEEGTREDSGDRNPLFDTPEKQAAYDKAMAEMQKAMKPIIDELKRSTRLTAADYAVVINAR